MPTLETRGVELSWRERGTGAPVLLIHETATASSIWDQVAEALATSLRAIAYDRRGWGSSTVPVGYARTTIEEQSEDAARLLESLVEGPAVACGAGTGAAIALDLMLRRNELVSAGLLIEPPILALLPEATELLSDDRRSLEAAAVRGRRGMIDLYLSGSLAALGAGAERIPEDLTSPARERPESVIAELGAVPAWSTMLPRLASAARPSLLLLSADTPPILRAAAHALAGRLPGAGLDEVRGPGPPHLGAPEEVAKRARALSGDDAP